jgi:Peptidase A4 family
MTCISGLIPSFCCDRRSRGNHAPPTGATFNGSDAEWIMEAPDGGEPFSALPSFSPVQFTTALACNNSTIANPLNGDYVNVVNGNQTLTEAVLGNDAVTIYFIG